MGLAERLWRPADRRRIWTPDAGGTWKPSNEQQERWLWEMKHPGRSWRPRVLDGGLGRGSRAMSPIYTPAVITPFDNQIIGAAGSANVRIPVTGTFPPTFSYLEFRYRVREMAGGAGGNTTGLTHLTFNGDTTAGHYAHVNVQLVSAAAANNVAPGGAYNNETSLLADARIGIVVNQGVADAGTWATGYATVLFYGDSDFEKVIQFYSGVVGKSALLAGSIIYFAGAAVWYSTAAVQFCNFTFNAAGTLVAAPNTKIITYLWN